MPQNKMWYLAIQKNMNRNILISKGATAKLASEENSFLSSNENVEMEASDQLMLKSIRLLGMSDCKKLDCLFNMFFKLTTIN